MKVLKELWMATDYQTFTHLFYEKPVRYEKYWHYENIEETDKMYISDNLNDQTWQDEPIKVKLILED